VGVGACSLQVQSLSDCTPVRSCRIKTFCQLVLHIIELECRESSSTVSEDEMEGGLLIDVVVAEGAAVFELSVRGDRRPLAT
jgi:hypothetical protein